jgi:hypothetical protein
VTAKPKDEDDSFGGGQKRSNAVENAVQMIVETLMTTAATELTRADVEQRLNELASRSPAVTAGSKSMRSSLQATRLSSCSKTLHSRTL